MTPNPAPVRLLGISGSLRSASFSSALIRLLAAHSDKSFEITLFELHDVPLYNEDIDGAAPQDKPAGVLALNAAIAESDGVIIATPEYNHGIPGVLKNALDWVSRPVFNSAFKGKPVSILSSSLASTGGVRAQYQLRETLTSMLAYVVPGPEVVIGGVHTRFKEEAFVDPATLDFMLAAIERLKAEITVRSPRIQASAL